MKNLYLIFIVLTFIVFISNKTKAEDCFNTYESAKGFVVGFDKISFIISNADCLKDREVRIEGKITKVDTKLSEDFYTITDSDNNSIDVFYNSKVSKIPVIGDKIKIKVVLKKGAFTKIYIDETCRDTK